MKKRSIIFLRAIGALMVTIAVVITPSCGVMYDVVSDTDVNTDFSELSTFAWVRDNHDSTCNRHYDRITRDNIRNYVGIELARRGFYTVPDTPDVLLRLTVHHHPTQTLVTHVLYPGYYHHRYYGRSRYYFPYPALYYYDAVFIPPPVVYIQTVPAWEGLIALDMFDRVSGRLIWSASARVNVHDRRYLYRDIHPAVETMMKRFPVRPKSNAVPGNMVYVSD